MSHRIDRRHYADIYGPTTGDRVRLGDTASSPRSSSDATVYGDECKFGGGKVLRDGMGQAAGVDRRATRSTASSPTRSIVDWTGIYKADVGIKDGRIAGIGKAGNPDVMAGVTAGHGRRRHDRGDRRRRADPHRRRHRHAHPLHLPAAGLRGARERRHDVHRRRHRAGDRHQRDDLHAGRAAHRADAAGDRRAAAELRVPRQGQHARCPKGSSSRFAPARSASSCTRTGARRRRRSTAAWRSPSDYDVQVAIHTDTLNESGFVDDSIAAFKGRTIHTYHTEGAGGGHAPDIIRVCGEPNVLPSSTNPTRPFTVNTLDEHLDMLMVCHHLDREHPRGRRVRREPHPRRDDRRRGRPARPRRDQHDVERQPGDGPRRRGHLPHLADGAQDARASAAGCRASSGDNDNLRIRRYVAKYTINPAIAHGIAHDVGSVEVGKLADLVLWKPAFFGVKPELVIKGGFIAWAQMGDANASIPTPQPVMMRPMFGAYGRATGATSLAFVSQARARRRRRSQRYGLDEAARRRARLPRHRQARHEAQRRAARA